VPVKVSKSRCAPTICSCHATKLAAGIPRNARFLSEDLWATPLMTFKSNAGDCENYAIAK